MTTNNIDINPFEDPSVRNITNQVSAEPNLDSFNPFNQSSSSYASIQNTETKSNITSAQRDPVGSQSQNMQKDGYPENPPPYEASSAQNLQAELQRRQEELERRAAEIQAREAQLGNSPSSSSNKNWPPLPKCCCVGPCFYQDIAVEIPNSYQKIVRTMYYMWIFYIFLLLLNMLGSLALFIANADGTTFGVSILIFLLFSPMSFVCWFRPLYKAFRTDSSFSFMVFFFVFFFQFVVSVFYAVGIPQWGSCGLLNGITTLLKGGDHTVSTYTVGIIAIFIGFLWAIDALISFYMLVKIHRMYRGTGASFAKAQEELAGGVLRNPNVQSAVSSAVSTAATNAVNQSANRAASGLRY